MTKAQRQAARAELESIQARAEALADRLDPKRTFSHRDEAARHVVTSADQIARAASRAVSILKVADRT